MARSPKVAIVTGSNRGIGEAIVRALRTAGYAAVTNGRSARKGLGDFHVRADVSTPSGARELISAVRRRFRGLDLLVNNVGDFRFTPVSEMRLDEWDELLDSTLRSAWLCCKEALPLLRRSKGSIVMIGGTATNTLRGNPRAVAYQMAKAALTIFAKSLAQSEARRGLRVNMINPGFIRTYAYTRKEVAELAPKVPAGRLGVPEEIAKAVVWLASGEASYVNGAVLDVGGGLWI